MKRFLSLTIILLFLGAILASVYFTTKRTEQQPAVAEEERIDHSTTLGLGSISVSQPDFVNAAKAVTPLVVHIKTTYNVPRKNLSPFDGMYGSSEEGAPQVQGSGSGVTVSDDGYIATNNHVVEDAKFIKVVYPDRREYFATLVGSDPNTDLALLKINASRLPSIKFGNSDKVQVGEWVLAVGYPYSLNTTVTAGIISAKGRSLGIINTSERATQPLSAAIESFIQTDAAINPGSSGGALVNEKGELIGINTAIASLTGSYSGYAFSIPVNLVKKVLEDLKSFGKVKRGILGVSFLSPFDESQYLKQQGINPGTVKGVFITEIQPGSAAEEAGLKEADIIQSIDGIQIFSSGEFSEMVARHRPADKINLTFLREGKVFQTSATLKGEETVTGREPETPASPLLSKLGADFSPLTPALEKRLNLRTGVVVTEVHKGGFFEQLGIRAGTVIAAVNGREVNSPREIEETLMEAVNARVQIIAIAPDGTGLAFNFSLGT